MRHFEIAPEQPQEPSVRRGQHATPYVPCGAKEHYQPGDPAALNELRIVLGYRDAKDTDR